MKKKPSKDIENRLVELLKANPARAEIVKDADKDLGATTVANALIIQCILDWLDENWAAPTPLQDSPTPNPL